MIKRLRNWFRLGAIRVEIAKLEIRPGDSILLRVDGEGRSPLERQRHAERVLQAVGPHFPENRVIATLIPNDVVVIHQGEPCR